MADQKMASIKLSDLSTNAVGEIEELTAKEKAQQTMTYWVLGIISALFILSAFA